MKKFYLIFLIIIFSSFLLSYFLYLLKPIILVPISSNTDYLEKKITIEKGKSFKEISEILRKEKLIKSNLAFKIYSLLSLSVHRLKAGNYSLSPSLSTPQIIELLVKGPEIDVKVTVLEGERLVEIDEKLYNAGIIKKGELINFNWQNLSKDFPFLKNKKSLEGFLFPDTYRFYLDSSIESVLRKFLENFQIKALPLLNTDHQLSFTNYQLLIFASLIEAEIPFYEDRLLVSSVLHKRLKINMPLQVDSAMITYEKLGLPEVPIVNPGLDAIYAAVHPQDSDYLYYLSDPLTKKTIFSKTLEEHNKNRWQYLKK